MDATDDPNTTRLHEHPVAGIEEQDGAVIVRLVGELDLYNAPTLREELTQVCAAGPERVVVDLAAVEFIDSTTLGVLIEARSRLANKRGFLLAAPGRETARALQISGLDRHLSVHDTVEAALAAPLV